MRERRRCIRFNAQENLIIEPQDGSSRSIKADLVDICFVGMGVNVQEKLAQGADVNFKLVTKLWDAPIIGKGKIVHVQEIKTHEVKFYRTGIDFTDIDQQAIRYIINRLQADICAEIRKKEQFKKHLPQRS